jgi:eukaryotic-like serine/threonine-protein kinase
MQTFGSPDNPDPLIGQVLLRGLRLVERLGATSEGPLYRGQYSATGPPVAVTVLRLPSASAVPSNTATLSERHWQQLRRACQIQHPNVAGLLDVGETPNGIIYAVGELLAGELVSDILAVSAGIPPEQAVDICMQVAEGLRAAHAVGVVHGSVSPRTVLVTGGGERLTVKLIRFDFTRRPEVHADAAAETPWADDRLDPTDDIVGVGLLLHCLLTGVPPDGERTGRAMPAALRRIIDRCLGGHGRPYPTMAALANDLARQAAAAVRPPSRLRRLRRRPIVIAALAASGVLLSAALWFGWSRIRADSTEARSEVGARVREAVPDSQPPPAASEPDRRADSRAAEPGGQRAISGVRGGRSSTAPRRGTPAPARDSSAALSPFRRSHPWAADPKGRVYFRSSCPRALRASDLLYFRTEAEARATGRTPSPDPRCS